MTAAVGLWLAACATTSPATAGQPTSVEPATCAPGDVLEAPAVVALAKGRLVHAFPEAVIEAVPRSRQVVVRHPTLGRTILSFDNLVLESAGRCVVVLAGVEARIATFRRMLAQAEGHEALPGRPEVRALVRSRADVERLVDMVADQTRAEGKTPDMPMIVPLVGDLAIVYAFDLPESVRWLLESDMLRLGLAEGDLEGLAASNLWSALRIEAKSSDDGSFVMFTAGGTYEASLMVVPVVWERLAAKVDGDPVVCVSNRDVLIATGTGVPDGVEKLGALCRHVHETGSYPISPRLYRWSAGVWTVL